MSDEIIRLPEGVCVIHTAQTFVGGSRLSYSVAISRETVGATQLAMSLVVVPPGGAARPHYHLAQETIIHVLKGRAETRYGQHLNQSVINGPGDFLYIGANVPHAPRNLSDAEESIALNARSDPSQQEPIVPIDPSVALDVTRRERDLVSLTAKSLVLAPGERFVEFGANGRTVGSLGLCMLRFVMAPRAQTLPHAHPHSETGVYIVSGEIETTFGDKLQHSVVNAAGDFLFLPAGLKHQLFNLRDGEAALVLARGDADEEKDTIELF